MVRLSLGGGLLAGRSKVALPAVPTDRSVGAGCAVLACALLAACSAPAARSPVGVSPAAIGEPTLEAPLGAKDLVTAWADGAARAQSEFSESLVARATLDGGGDVYIRLLITNVAGADGRAELKTRIHLADGRELEGRVRMRSGEWLFGSDGFQVSLGGDSAHVVPGRAEFELTGPGFTANLTITSNLPAVRPAGGSADFGGGAWYRTLIPIPRGRLTGTLSVAEASSAVDPDPDRAPGVDAAAGTGAARGPESIALAGAAYLELRAGTVAPYAMARRWLNLLDIDAERCVVMSAFQRTQRLGGQTQGWLYYATDDALEVLVPELRVTATGAEVDAETGFSVPQRVAVHGRGLEGAIEVTRLVKRIDDLEDLGRVERFVVERVMTPWTFRYDATFQLNRPGVEPLRGSARYQVQQLN